MSSPFADSINWCAHDEAVSLVVFFTCVQNCEICFCFKGKQYTSGEAALSFLFLPPFLLKSDHKGKDLKNMAAKSFKKARD